MPTDPLTNVYIAQDVLISNVVTFPVVSPNSSGTSISGMQAKALPPTTPPPATPSAPATSKPKIAAVDNAASYSSSVVSPGENVVVFGSGLGPASLTQGIPDSAGILATTLSDTQVLFDEMPAPLVYVMDGQTSAMVPYEVGMRATTKVQVVYKGVGSDPVT